MIHESGSIASSKQKGNLKGCTKWKVFIGRRRVGQEGINKRKERIASGQAIIFWRRGVGNSRGLYHEDYFTTIDQEISDHLVTFLGEVETASKTWSAVVPGGK